MGLAQRIKAPRRRTGSGEMPRVVPLDRTSGTRLRGEADLEDLADGDVVSEARTIARACHEAAAGLGVCARRCVSADLAARLAEVATHAHAAAEAASALVPDGVRRPSTSERLRWEWLASTAATLDEAPERRVAEEAVRHLGLAAAAAGRACRSSSSEPVHALLSRVQATATAGLALVSGTPTNVAFCDQRW
jgi:hypothetical protein